MNREFMDALEQVEREKGVSKEILLDAIETALASAYKRDQKVAQSIEVRIDPESCALHVYTHKTVVDEVEDDKNEISLAEAQQIKPQYELGDLVEFEIFPKDFGRIAAQTAKQVVVQRIREAERSIIYDEFINRVGDLITGIVHRFEQRNIFIDLGRIEGIMPANEQMPNEHYEPGMRLKTYVVEVKKTTKGPQVLLSRARTGMLKRLFELEVPEIQDGLVEIKVVAREPGHRSKVAVISHDQQIDPVGACVGARGIRVQMIVRELKGEKIDIIPWSPDAIDFIINALSPAKVSEVKLLPSKKTAIVIVPDFQLSLAIGKEGQNARLAAKLTGWKIDIKSETQAAEQAETIDRLIDEELGFKEPEESAAALTPEELANDLEAAAPSAELAEAATPEEEEEDEEKVVAKKRPKKAKAAPKHLARVELEEEPVSLEEGYFFADVLEEKNKDQQAAGASSVPAAKGKTKAKSAKAAAAPTSEDEAAGFTIGQLLGKGLAPEKLLNKTKTTAAKPAGAKVGSKTGTAKPSKLAAPAKSKAAPKATAAKAVKASKPTTKTAKSQAAVAKSKPAKKAAPKKA